MGELSPYLYFNSAGNLMRCFYTYRTTSDGYFCSQKEPGECEISEEEAKAKYPVLYAEALENLKKRQEAQQAQKKQEAKLEIEIQQPLNRGIEKVVAAVA